MWANLGSFLQVASAILVITSLAGLGAMRSRVTSLAATVGDLRGEVGDKDRQLTELHALRVLDAAEILRQGNDIDALQRLKTGEAHWTAISQELRAHHTASIEHWSADEELLGRILQAMREGNE